MMQIAKQSWCATDIIHSLGSLPKPRLATVSILDLCPSTNDYLLSRKPPPKGKFNLCVARYQNKGRGRRGKAWSSKHNGIYLSVSWQASSDAVNGGWMLLMTALRLTEELQALGISGIGIKWPNDLYYKNAKLAGMLFEQSGDLAVMGIGLNIATPVDELSESKISWVGLDQVSAAKPTYYEILALVAKAALAVSKPIAFAEGRRRFSSYDILYNCPVEIERKGKRVSGVAQGIDKGARLLVANNKQVEAYEYGEISIRNDRITNRCRQ